MDPTPYFRTFTSGSFRPNPGGAPAASPLPAMDAILDYVLLHFRSVYPHPAFPFGIQYGLGGTAPVQIFKSGTSFFEWAGPAPTRVTWREWEGRQIPFFFDEPAEGPLLTRQEGHVVLNSDLIASAFYLLSGWQEYHSTDRDQFNRFPYRSSVQRQHGFIAVPVVNYYFDVLRQAIEQAHGFRLTPKPWGEGPFATCLTHDVDRLESGWKSGAEEELKRGNLPQAARLVLQKLLGRDAWFNLPDVMDLLERYGARGTFLFLPNHRPFQGHPNADYDVASPRYQRELAEVERRGHEIGVHGSFQTAVSSSRLRQEAERLQRPVKGNRFHYLCYDPAVTPGVLAESGLQYDSTLGFAEHFGFRHSYCFPFWPFDFKNRQPFRFLEIPLHLMDVTLHHPHYLMLAPEAMLEAVRPMLEEIRRFGGCFTLLWHNENLEDRLFEGARQVLEQIISRVASQNTVFLKGSAIEQHMQERLKATYGSNQAAGNF